MATLLLTLPTSGDVAYELAGASVSLGRSPENDIRIEDGSISPQHALFVAWGTGYRLKNLDGHQQTWVNGQACAEAELTSRCFLRLGDVEGLFFPQGWKGAPLDLHHQLAKVTAERDMARELCRSLTQELENERERHRQMHAELLVLSRQMQTSEGALHEAKTRAEQAQRGQLRAAHEKLTEEVAATHHEIELLTNRWNDLVTKLRRVQEAEAQVDQLMGGGPASHSWTAQTALKPLEPKIFPWPPSASLTDFNLPPESPETSIAVALQAMQEARDRLTANAHDHEALHGAFGHARALAQSVEPVSANGAVRRMASALEALLGDLCKVPEQLDAPKLHTMSRALETLQRLAARDQFSSARDSFRAKICVVSDDAEEPMIAALRLVDLDLSTFNYPTARLDSAGEQECELIVLDPGSREPGWAEYCARLRHFPQHKKTPLIVLIPFPDAHDHHLPRSLGGHEDFIEKPFNIFEMSVKILGGIFQHRLDHARPPS